MRLQHLIDDLNIGTYNPVGLNILWPRNVAFLYVSLLFLLSDVDVLLNTCSQLEIEYYVSDPASRRDCSLMCMNSDCSGVYILYFCFCAKDGKMNAE